VKKPVCLVVFVAILLIGAPGFAQTRGCEFDDGFKEFDFWIGNWKVFDNSSDELAGTNLIQKQEAGCLVLEKWKSTTNITGTSLNYYNPVTKQWRQLWVSEGAYSIDIVGGLEDGSMRLTGKIYDFASGENQFRGTWTPAGDGSVRQFFEQFNNGTQQWEVWFDGRYVKSD